MDLILGGFADLQLGAPSEDQIAEFEELLDESDRDVYSWISGALPIPDDANGRLPIPTDTVLDLCASVASGA